MPELAAGISDDPRREGWPCFRKHVTRARGNQHAAWMTCQRCALRTSYVTKAAGHGQRRALGIAAEILETALAELQDVVSPEDCTEKIVTGKIMEVKGRQLQASGGGLDYCVRPGTSVPAARTFAGRMGNLVAAASGEADGPTSTWLSRHRPAAGRTRAASVPPSVKTEDLCRETGGADQKWEELDRLEAELMERKARLGARPKQHPHQRRGEALLSAAGV